MVSSAGPAIQIAHHPCGSDEFIADSPVVNPTTATIKSAMYRHADTYMDNYEQRDLAGIDVIAGRFSMYFSNLAAVHKRLCVNPRWGRLLVTMCTQPGRR
eukprot:GHVQ01015314.1.p1 GENE.GHVQ01015314.1~~GHVQ01015314.1.p1  ORF type:complete len:100 (+),score=8.10 GHVQ01015314.1:224-523(+)